MQVDREQALAFRRAGQHLHERTDDPLQAIAACGLQDSPPGWWPVALHARCTTTDVDPDAVVQVNAMRHAPFVVPRADLDVFTRALVPEDPAGLKRFVGSLPAKEVAAHGLTPREALDLVQDAARDALADGPLELGPFHQALRERLPDSVLPYCRGCDSHHVRSGFWRGLGPLGVTVMPAKSTWALAPAPQRALDDARAEVVRRFLRTHGPATHTQLGEWAGCGPAHAKALLALIDDELEDLGKHWLLAEDLPRYGDPPPSRGVRLLPGFDPYVAQPDREALVPDKALRTALFPAIGRPNLVLHDGELVGSWKARKKGKRLEVEVTWFADAVDLEDELRPVAQLRGAEFATAKS